MRSRRVGLVLLAQFVDRLMARFRDFAKTKPGFQDVSVFYLALACCIEFKFGLSWKQPATLNLGLRIWRGGQHA